MFSVQTIVYSENSFQYLMGHPKRFAPTQYILHLQNHIILQWMCVFIFYVLFLLFVYSIFNLIVI